MRLGSQCREWLPEWLPNVIRSIAGHATEPLHCKGISGTPGGTRIPNLLIRSVTQGGHPDPWGAASAQNLCQVEAGSVGRTRYRDCTPRFCSIAVVPLRRGDKLRDSTSLGTPNVFAPGCDWAAAADDGLEAVQ